jgi:hypothetical protein
MRFSALSGPPTGRLRSERSAVRIGPGALVNRGCGVVVAHLVRAVGQQLVAEAGCDLDLADACGDLAVGDPQAGTVGIAQAGVVLQDVELLESRSLTVVGISASSKDQQTSSDPSVLP